MPSHTKTLPAIAALTASLLFPVSALADITVVETEEGDTMTFEYEGSNLRIDMPDNADGYMLMRDSKMYVVTMNDGQPMVLDMSSAFRMFGNMAASATPSTVESKVISLKATGQSETLAGIKGEVYELRFVDHEGKERQEDMVLSNDPLARGFRDAIQNMAMTMAESLDKNTYQNEIEAGEQMQAKLEALNMGVLRYGGDMKVKSIKDTTVAAERFVLPAEPTDLGGILSGALGGGQSGSQSSGNSSGGLFGGMFGGSQSGDGDEAAEPEEPKEEKSAAEAVGEAFGKLFGN